VGSLGDRSRVTGSLRGQLQLCRKTDDHPAVSLLEKHRSTGRANLAAHLFEDDDHVSFLVSGFYITVSLGDLVQRIASIDHCP
jgi:hypothetical protein